MNAISAVYSPLRASAPSFYKVEVIATPTARRRELMSVLICPTVPPHSPWATQGEHVQFIRQFEPGVSGHLSLHI